MKGLDLRFKPGEQTVMKVQYTLPRALIERRAELAKQVYELLSRYIESNIAIEETARRPCYFDLVEKIGTVEDKIRQQLDVTVKGIAVKPAVLRKEAEG